MKELIQNGDNWTLGGIDLEPGCIVEVKLGRDWLVGRVEITWLPVRQWVILLPGFGATLLLQKSLSLRWYKQ